MLVKNISIIIFTLCLVLPMACTIDTPEMPLTKEDKNMIDSIYRVKSKIVREEVDSLCDIQFERFVEHAVDSIIEERLQEIERLINRQ